MNLYTQQFIGLKKNLFQYNFALNVHLLIILW
jgi:hypothetical protein